MSNILTPEVNAEGQYIGSSLEQRTEGAWRHFDQADNFIYNELDGTTRHITDGEEFDGLDGPTSNDEQYISDLVSLHGGPDHFQQMTAWAAANADPSRIQWFNDCLDEGSVNSLNEAMDWLSGEYSEATAAPTDEYEEEAEATEVDEWYNSLDPEAVEADLQALESMEIDEDASQVLAEVSQQFPEDSAECLIARAGQLIASGDIDMQTAIQAVIHQYGEAEAARAYYSLSNLLN